MLQLLAPAAHRAKLPDVQEVQKPKCTKGGSCKGPASQLNSNRIPKSLADVKSFLCEARKSKALQRALCNEEKTKA